MAFIDVSGAGLLILNELNGENRAKCPNFFLNLIFLRETKDLWASGVGGVSGARGAHADPGKTRVASSRELFCLPIMEPLCAKWA